MDLRHFEYLSKMQITVNIPDDFAARVEARGMSPQGYIDDLIREELATAGETVPPDPPSIEEFKAAMDALARFSDKIPALPLESLSRQRFYEEHD